LAPSPWLTAFVLASLSSACHSTPLDSARSETEGGAASVGGTESAAGASAPVLYLPALERVHISSDPSAEHFQRASAEVDFGDEPVARAIVGITLESPCFPFEGWADPGVRKGQRWPELCDAFDRTISLTLDEPAPDAGGAPGIELLRAITPFGGPLHVDADVTDVVNGLPGKHQLGLRIDTWSDADGLVSGSKGEWIASVDLTTQLGAAPRRVLSVVPLVLGAQTEVDVPAVPFDVPEGAQSARLEYRVTGHGAAFAPGCIGPAEEFCRRTHELRLDGDLLTDLSPWRDDCAELCSMTVNDSGYGPSSYCKENPCGDPASVRAPRANWCPGSMTAAFLLEAPALTVAGPHEFSRSIHELATGGTWLVSATYFAFE
jgi:Peptide-N-glycosidase F, C terminal